MSDLSRFLFEEDRPLRTVMRDGEPWFVLVDVCRILGVKNPTTAVLPLDDDEKTTIDALSLTEGTSGCGTRGKGVGLADNLGRNQAFILVSESGLYFLIMRSRAATTPGTIQHRFRRWVTKEVLPEIRRTGGYRRELLALKLDDFESDEGRHKFAGDRFREERERLGFTSAHHMADVLGLGRPKITAFEQLGYISKRLPDMQTFEAIGFDTLYWRTGIRTITTAERKILDCYRPPESAGVATRKLDIPGVARTDSSPKGVSSTHTPNRPRGTTITDE